MKFKSQHFLSLPFLPSLCSAFSSPLNSTFDYIIVGSGASGIPLADRLSETGASVLLLERGFASSGRWGGTWKPDWLEGTNLTRFDVPALAQLVWTEGFDNAGVFCDNGKPSPAGCMLGGGPAVNAGQFYLPTPNDFDWNQPPGFQSRDMENALKKVKERLPWTDTPSMDGKSYLGNGSQIALNALTNTSVPGHFRFIVADEENDRERATSKAEFFFLNGEKGGPMATYLVTASQRSNFQLHMNTTVARVLCNGETATGVEVESSGPGGLTGTINVTPGTGRVILSAGVFNTFKILVRSGTGPLDQIAAISDQKNSTEASKLPPKRDWLDIPVGHNLADGVNFYLAVSVPGVEYYPWEGLWNSTTENPDIARYLENRTGPLAELQPGLGPVSWDTITGADGRKRVVQWDSTAGKSGLLPGDGGYMAFASGLNLGHTSRGQLTLNPSDLSVNISTSPYLNDQDDHDFAAVLKSSTFMLELINTTILQQYPGSFMIYPGPGQSIEEYLRQAPKAGSNHWAGTAKMGEKCGGEGVVVDTSTRICGMKNLHVVDASIFNGLPTANPQATYITMAEKGAEVILGMAGGC